MGKTKVKKASTQEPVASAEPTPDTPPEVVSAPEPVAAVAPLPESKESLESMAADIAATAPEAQPGLMEARRLEAAESAAAENTAPNPVQTTEPAKSGPGKRGRPRKAESELKEPRRVKVADSAAAPSQSAAPPTPGPMVNAQTAAMFTGIKESVTMNIIGDEWKLTDPEKALENSTLAAALDHYCPDGMPVNPLVLYAAISINHASMRFSQPQTKSWWTRTKVSLYSRWLKMRGKVDAPHIDSRPDNDRKDDISDATGKNGAGESPPNNP